MDGITEHINQSKLDVSNAAGKASVNIATGRLLYEFADMVVGSNSYAMGISRIYDSSKSEDDKDYGFGKGWKLNIRQTLKWENGDLVYTDVYGYKHIFNNYDEMAKKYYDTTGLGLTLYDKDGEWCIEDAQGGRMYFTNGNLTRTESALNANINKPQDKIIQYIKYDGDLIVKVYDNRKKSRAIIFEYNEDDRISCIKCAESGNTVYYSYDGDKLISVRETRKSEGRFAVSYRYDNSKLTYAVATMSKTALRFTYDESGKATNICDGIMQTSFKLSEARPALYMGNDVYASPYKHCGQKERRTEACGVSDNDSDFEQGQQSITLTYGSNQTAVKNKQNVTNVYFLNAKGFTTSILERESTNKYKTLFKDTGLLLSTASGSGETINGHPVETVTGKYYFSDEINKTFKDYRSKYNHEDNGDCVLSFWAKLKKVQSTSVKVQLKAECKRMEFQYVGDNSEPGKYIRFISQYLLDKVMPIGSATLDHTATGWQYITIPFPIKLIEDYWKSDTDMNIPNVYTHTRMFESMSSLQFSISDGVEIADMRVISTLTPSFEIKQSVSKMLNLQYEKRMTVDEIVNVHLQTGYNSDKDWKTLACSNDFFVTESDIIQTTKEMAKNGSKPFAFIHNGGTKRIGGVLNVVFSNIKGDESHDCDNDPPRDELDLTYNIDKRIPLICYPSSSTRYENCTVYSPNYLYASVPSSGNYWTYNYTDYYVKDGKIKDIRNRTVVETNDNKLNEYTIKNKAVSKEYTIYNALGKEVEKCDAYGVKTSNIYDECGNLIKTEISGKDTSEVIKTEYTYDADKEILLYVNDGVRTVMYDTEQTTGAVNSASIGTQKAEYKYNSFCDSVREVKLAANDTVYGKNTLTYDRIGRLVEVSPSSEYRYGVEYDRFGNPTKFSLNGTAILEKVCDYANNTVTAKYMRSPSAIDSIKTEYDKYGRIMQVVDGDTVKVKTEYQNIAESPSCAKAAKITDSYAGRTCVYKYDPYNNQPTEYDVTDTNGKKIFNAVCTDANEVKYDFSDDVLDFKSAIIKDENCMLSPRVVTVTNDSHFGMEWTFTYDGLGRIKEREDTTENRIHRHATKINHYKSGTTLRTQIEYDKPGTSNIHETIDHTYDSKGNVTTSRYTYKSGSDSKLTTATTLTSYSYDAANRLFREANNALGFIRKYEYNFDGTVASVTEGSNIENYIYDKGRLISVTDKDENELESYKYDLFGNPTEFKNQTPLVWTRGTMLQKYGKISYAYDASGRLIKKTDANGRVHKFYYDGDKLIAQEVGDKKIRYFYDDDGVAGFKVGIDNRYTFCKDAQGNVVSLCSGTAIIAWYLYDAWGQCKVVDKDKKEITDWDEPAMLNPFRWKSQYYDTDTELYYIGNRWYDPERGRYISAASPETLLQSAGTVYALNPYNFAVNPVNVLLYCGSMYPSLDFYYDGRKPWWEEWGLMILAIVVLVAVTVAVLVSAFTDCLGCPLVVIGKFLFDLIINTIVSTAVALAIGGTIAGIQSAKSGNGFWEGFNSYVSDNIVTTLVTCFMFAAVSGAINTVLTSCVQCFKEGTLVQTDDGLKPIEEIEVGDYVLAYNEETGEQEYKQVLHLFRNESKDWIGITVNGTEAESTLGHKYYLPKTNEWKSAGELKVGTKVLLSDGECGIIEKVRRIHYDEPQTTYNFEVEDFHTYYVGAGVLVHNLNCAITPDGQEVYRGGNDMTLKQGEYRLDANGLVKPTHGLSVNADPSAVAKFGGAYKIISMPEGLQLIQRGANLMHFEIVPQYAMPLDQFQSLLYLVQLIPV